MKVISWKYALWIAGLVTILTADVGCKKTALPASTAFPNSNEVTGWTHSGEIRTFAASELSNYIDGDAEKYLKAGVRSASTTDYKFGDQIQAVADIYTMSAAVGARSIFDSEPTAGAENPSVGEAARLYSQSLMFREGPYLVRIVAYQVSPQLRQGLIDLGLGIEKKLPM
jgi:hypothetical protein